MNEERTKRKLSGILSADAVGYSRLMEQDEASTIRTLEESKEVMANLIEQYRGRVVDAPGDNLLAEFGSVVDATDCAVKIQQELKAKNAELSDDKKMEFRIGVNLGDVVEEADRIYGDGVNIAAHIEGLSGPGGIAISRTAYDHVKNKLKLGYEYLGEHSVKNISEPVQVYRVLMDPESAGKVIGEKRFLGKISRRVAIAAGVVFVIVAAVLIGWNIYLHQSRKVEAASLDQMAFPLPDKPSIAVLHFDYMGDVPGEEYIAGAVSENLITVLSKFPNLFVTAKESSFSYKGNQVKIKQISEELGVRYVLEGSLQKSGDHVRVTAQLIDAIKGYHVWSDTYDRELKDFFALQDDLILNILNGLQTDLTTEYEGWGRGTNSPEALLKVHKAEYHKFQFTREDMAISRKLYKEAIALDPEYAFAYNGFGWTYIHDVLRGYSKSKEKSLDQAEVLARRAIELDPSLAEAYSSLAYIFLLRREFKKAIAEGERAIAMDPNSSSVLVLHAMTLNTPPVGRHEEALSLIEQAIRINPKPASWVFYELGVANQWLEKYEEAIRAFKKSLIVSPNNFGSWQQLVFCYVATNHMREAKKAAAEVLRIQPSFNIDFIKKLAPKIEEDEKGRFYLNSLRKAGIPEHPPSK